MCLLSKGPKIRSLRGRHRIIAADPILRVFVDIRIRIGFGIVGEPIGQRFPIRVIEIFASCIRISCRIIFWRLIASGTIFGRTLPAWTLIRGAGWLEFAPSLVPTDALRESKSPALIRVVRARHREKSRHVRNALATVWPTRPRVNGDRVRIRARATALLQSDPVSRHEASALANVGQPSQIV